MLDFSVIFNSVTRTLYDGTRDPAHPLSEQAVGIGASVDVLATRRVTAQKTPVVAQFGAQSEVFEGRLASSKQAEWSAHDVLSADFGIPLGNSSLIEGFRAFVEHQGGLNAAVVGEILDNGLGYATGGFVDLLKDGVSGTSVAVGVMSSVAGLYRPEAEAYDYDGSTKIADIYLDGLYPSIGVGDIVIVENGDVVMASYVTATTVDGRGFGDALVPVSLITIGAASLIGVPVENSSTRVWFDARKAGTIQRIPTLTVTDADILNNARPVTLRAGSTLPTADTNIIIQDAEGTTIPAKGGGSSDNEGTPRITITQILEPDPERELVKPITFLWGLTKVTRGETVNREIVGSGNAVIPWQSLKLAKSPLTYVADPFAPGGRKPELEIYVNGLKWRRALSFYGAVPTDEIYVIRHDADHQTYIQFGDGELGKRLPSGTNNIVATYRFGTGGNVEANTITKLVRPIAGVTKVSNPLAASGGEDPPTEEQAREQAIQSLRVLGRLVSLADFEVEAARYGGVVKAKARWDWDDNGEDAVVKVWIVCEGPGDPSPELRTYLQNMAEPGARVHVVKATPFYAELTLDLEFDPDYIPQDVLAAVDAQLFDPHNGFGALRNAQIGGVFHRSQLYAAIHDVEGVLSVRGITADDTSAGKYLRLDDGSYLVFVKTALS